MEEPLPKKKKKKKKKANGRVITKFQHVTMLVCLAKSYKLLLYFILALI